jgi:hypothetical protein
LIKIEIIDGTPRTVNSDLVFDKSVFPKKAHVVLYATCTGSEHVQRKELGSIGSFVQKQNFPLDNKLSGKNVQFTLRIIDTSQEVGRILGIAENIKTINAAKKEPEGKLGILPVVASDKLGEQLWQLDFGNQEVSLLVNKAVEGLDNDFENDPTISCLVLPAVIREILYRAFLEDGEDMGELGGWQATWVKFSEKLDPLPETKDWENIKPWIENVVDIFCNQHRFKQSYTKNTGENV